MTKAEEIYERLAQGDAIASNEMFELVYDELHRMAKSRLREQWSPDSLQTTALVHEAYLRLVGREDDWKGRSHFFGAAAEAMRRILVDRARHRRTLKRGGDWQQIPFAESIPDRELPASELLAVDELFDQLAEQHPAEAEIAKLRYFAGFSAKEAASILDIPASTAYRHWQFAKAWLLREMGK
ncbi:MAG: ECF-type sigma factor [Pirellulaceae bacterium]